MGAKKNTRYYTLLKWLQDWSPLSEVRRGFDDDVVPEKKVAKEKKEPEDPAFLRWEVVNEGQEILKLNKKGLLDEDSHWTDRFHHDIFSKKDWWIANSVSEF